MTKKEFDVSIILTNWNTCDFMRDCIRSIYEKTLGITYEIIVVDDGSTDGSVEMLRKEFPEVKVVVNERNLGVAKAYNRGVAIANGRYVQMLNTDMILVNNAIKILVDFIESHPDAGACGGRLRNSDMTSQISYGIFPSFNQALVDALFLKEIFPKWGLSGIGTIPPESMTEPVVVEYITGADMLIRKIVIEKIGFLDERYTSYCEETDFCYRICHQTDWKLYFVPKAEIIHFVGMSFKNVRKYRYQLLYSSYNKFFTKHHGSVYSLATRLLYAFQYIVKFIARSLRYFSKHDNDHKQLVIEAYWQVKYSLFPGEW